MKKISFVKAMAGFVLMAIAIGAIGGDLNPGNTPSPTMRTLDELYKNIQPGLPSDWVPFAKEQQVIGNSSIHLQLSTTENGSIGGSCEVQGKSETIVVIGLGHEIELPYDLRSGLPTAQRLHHPIIISKYIDRSSPLLYKALCRNETVDHAYLRYYRTLPNGQEQLYYTTHLEGGKIISIKSAFPNIEQVTILYSRITWTYETEEIRYVDDVPYIGV